MHWEKGERILKIKSQMYFLTEDVTCFSDVSPERETQYKVGDECNHSLTALLCLDFIDMDFYTMQCLVHLYIYILFSFIFISSLEILLF